MKRMAGKLAVAMALSVDYDDVEPYQATRKTKCYQCGGDVYGLDKLDSDEWEDVTPEWFHRKYGKRVHKRR